MYWVVRRACRTLFAGAQPLQTKSEGSFDEEVGAIVAVVGEGVVSSGQHIFPTSSGFGETIAAGKQGAPDAEDLQSLYQELEAAYSGGQPETPAGAPHSVA